ncbi:YfhO family protein [Aerococcus viridans]|uniref:YfhO family protein n=1 Tax=Aerococcus viridans TaxID=1377 RepID=UPI003B2119ED
MKAVKAKPMVTEIFILLLLFSASILMHYFFISNQLNEDLFMAGPNDQTNQMLIFKDFLYKEFTNGNFFYSFDYNGGSNFFSKLSYYYTTSIFYYLTVIATWVLNKLSIIGSPDIVYWGEISLYISIIKSTFIAYLAHNLISKYQVRKSVSLFAATFYAFSSIYFRHAVLWEFFTDAMLWLPIILIGIEHIFNGKKGWIFSLGVALTLFNNGYFAFANLLISGCYILARLFIRFNDEEITLTEKIKNAVLYGVIGIGISALGFLPFVKGFLDNSRSSVEILAPLWSNDLFTLENMLMFDTVQVIPFIFLFILFCWKNYKSIVFRFFASISSILILMKYSPKIASLFNGFSFPQYRWHYITFLFMAITIAIGVEQIMKYKQIKASIISSTLVLLIYFFTLKHIDLTVDFSKKFIFALVVIGALLFILLSVAKKVSIQNFALFALFALTIPFINEFNSRLFDQYNLKKVTQEHLYNSFEDPNTDFSKAIQFIENDTDQFYRIEYEGISNLGIAYEQSTFNNYSSFQNKYEREFIDYFGITNTKDNSVSIDGLGARQILNSLFQIDYVIAADNEQYIVPTGFERVKQFDSISVYKNKYPLAFIHPVNNFFAIDENTVDEFKDAQLIDGVIKKGGEGQSAPTSNAINFTLENNSSYQNNYIESSEESVQIVLNVDPNENFDEVVIDYSLKADTDNNSGKFDYWINGMKIGMNAPNGKYTLQQFHHQVSIPHENQIEFTFTSGTGYEFEVNKIYGLSYDQLESRAELDKSLDYRLNIGNDEISIDFNNVANYPFMVLPLFYEDGWQLEINNQKVDIENVNGGMIGFEIPNGKMNIKMKFVQPYLYSSMFISIVFIIVLVLVDTNMIKKMKKRIVKS